MPTNNPYSPPTANLNDSRSNASFDKGRRLGAYVIASACILTALFQIAAALILLNQAEISAALSVGDDAMRIRIFLPLCVAICMNLAAGIFVYHMRIEALACMGYLLIQLFARMFGKPPVQPLTFLDLSILIVTIYFTIRLFRHSSAPRPETQSIWKHPVGMLLIGLAGGHLTVIGLNWQAYPALISMGAVSPQTALAAFIGCVAFYTAILILQVRIAIAKKLFLLGAVAMGMSLPAWKIAYGLSAPFWIGVPVALFGFGLARHLEVTKLCSRVKGIV